MKKIGKNVKKDNFSDKIGRKNSLWICYKTGAWRMQSSHAETWGRAKMKMKHLSLESWKDLADS